MLIHGRLILTASGLPLDEVRSLLQKSLRRKEHGFATAATKELLGRGKDHLPWKSLVTFLFEDHCLNGENILLKFIQLHKKKDRYGTVELLLKHCFTCRVAACLPVIAIDAEYYPVSWDPDLTVDESLRGLIEKQPSRIDIDLLLQHLKEAWIASEAKKIITYMKMATMIQDHDKRSVTAKGSSYVYYGSEMKKHNVGMVILTMLSKASRSIGNIAMEKYSKYCCYLAGIRDVPVRLVMFAAVAQYIHSDKVKSQAYEALKTGQIAWTTVPRLKQMPPWAVDKHTFRGKFGKGTKHLLKPADMKKFSFSDSELEEFHGERPKQDITHFFTEGVQCEHQVMEENQYWKRCTEIYLERPKKLQKTIHMTAVYYADLLKKYPHLKTKTKGKQEDPVKSVSHKLTGKRKCDDTDSNSASDFEEPPSKRLKKHTSGTAKLICGKSVDQTNEAATTTKSPNSTIPVEQVRRDEIKHTNLNIQDRLTNEHPCTDGPLLQLPTGSAKMYTRVDLAKQVVWKGPYINGRVKVTMFLHQALLEVLGDVHTLDVKRHDRYIQFPLLQGHGADMKITTKDFYDCIAKRQVTNGQFILRDNLGIIQLHKLPPEKIQLLPPSIWCHFLYRYLFNVGDSGLYNAVTDRKMSFVYGIDMEEQRKNVTGSDLVSLMFTKLPRKEICHEIKKILKKRQVDLGGIMGKTIDTHKIEALATYYGVAFDLKQFNNRLHTVRNLLKI